LDSGQISEHRLPRFELLPYQPMVPIQDFNNVPLESRASSTKAFSVPLKDPLKNPLHISPRTQYPEHHVGLASAWRTVTTPYTVLYGHTATLTSPSRVTAHRPSITPTGSFTHSPTRPFSPYTHLCPLRSKDTVRIW
ncbi:hypothetical protein BaRGS_00026197, partial [Batillaria attramentaria]